MNRALSPNVGGAKNAIASSAVKNRRAGALIVLAMALGSSCTSGSQPTATGPASPTAAPPSSTGTAQLTPTPSPRPSAPQLSANPSAPVATLAATPAITGLTGRIVFFRVGGSYAEGAILLVNADGSDEQLVSTADCCPRFSPDGQYLSSGGVLADGRITTTVRDADGSHPRLIPIADPTLNLGPGPWLHAGHRIVVEGWDYSDPSRDGLYAHDALDGRHLVRITEQRAIPLDISPDDEALLYLGPGGKPGFEDPVGALWVVGMDGSNPRRISPEGTDAAYTARWSPDGQSIIFADAWWVIPGAPIWSIQPDGTGLHRLFTDPGGRSAVTPTWSPDGSMIVFGLAPASGDVHSSSPLFVIRADGTGLIRVVSAAGANREPEWAPGD